ncbi:MAG: ribosomal protein S12 [Rhodospirillaceae bacterium]|nr:MAG: ribosomal protein S12 [Rhodospirillaceae bacterium]TNC97764.1 MAG: ribosomal protein S12 methylthiotransferase [Stygiobacter sp.]
MFAHGLKLAAQKATSCTNPLPLRSITIPKIGIVSLGCAKALVDSERILTRLRAEGYDISDSYDGADVVVVNTCGFLDSARAESLEAIGEAMNENGRVIVTGCMGGEEDVIRKAHPDVLAVTGPHQYQQVVDAVHQAAPPESSPLQSLVPPEGLHLTPSHYAYLKISEGCNHRCSFCIIPGIRGDLASRPVGEVLEEAERLAMAGIKEILVISQDTGAYGLDIKYTESPWHGRAVRARLTEMAEALGDLGVWTRLHYVYPYPHVDEVIPLMAAGKILPYLDIPFQHASPKVLKAMRRPADHERLLERINGWREICPDLAIRSTFIVGFPGETEEDFEFLLDWLQKARIDRVGCFKYENVAGAAANQLAEHVDEDVKEERYNRLMEVARQISDEISKAKIGKTIEVIIDEVDEDGAYGRSWADSPEVDGCVYINHETEAQPGDVVMVTVEHAEDFDLWGRIVGAAPERKRRF